MFVLLSHELNTSLMAFSLRLSAKWGVVYKFSVSQKVMGGGGRGGGKGSVPLTLTP